VLLASSAAADSAAAPSRADRPPAPVVRRLAAAPTEEHPRPELRFPRALEPLRGRPGTQYSGSTPSLGRAPAGGGASPSPAERGQLRMPPGLARGAPPESMPTVSMPQPGGSAGWAERLGRPIAGMALLALGLAGAWWALRRRARVE
jgi:hypothetical protein